MTITREKKGDFLPRKLVPVGEPIIVYYGGKPPKARTREYQGKSITEVTFWVGIADITYPYLVGQYHPFSARSWIAPGKPGAQNVDPPKPPTQPSKLYEAVQAMGGQEMADAVAYHDAALDLEDPTLDEEQCHKAIPAEWWKGLKGFYVAEFKEPRKDKETKEPIIAEDGGIFWQEIAQLKPLKSARIFSVEQLQANVIWPPPKPEPVSKPEPATEPPKAEPPKAEPPAEPTPPKRPVPEPLDQVLSRIKERCGMATAYNGFKNDFVKRRSAAAVSKMADPDIRLLDTLLAIRVDESKHSAHINEQLLSWKKILIELTQVEADLILHRMQAESDDVPF